MLAGQRTANQTLGGRQARSSDGAAQLRWCSQPAHRRSVIMRSNAAPSLLQRHGRTAAAPGSSRLHWQRRQPRSVACSASRNHWAAASSAAAMASTAAAPGSTDSAAATPSAGSDWPTVPPAYQHMTYLQELRLHDFVLVSRARVRFTPGLNAISGQSGAGKSLLLDALAQLLGAAGQPDCVRPPADVAVVEGAWWLGPGLVGPAASLLAELGLPGKALPGTYGSSSSSSGSGGSGDTGGGGGVLHIRREISRSQLGGAVGGAAPGPSSRSRVVINGCPSSLRVLRALGALLVDVNGQHASLALRDSTQQLQLLDRIAGTSAVASRLAVSVSRLAQLEARLADVDALGDAGERAALQKRVELITRAALKPGEEVSLRRRLAALESRRGCLEAAAAVTAGIAGDSGGGGGASSSAPGSSASLLEALRIVSGQLRGVLAAEEQQQRMAQQERQQRQQQQRRRSSSNGRSSSPLRSGRDDEGGSDNTAHDVSHNSSALGEDVEDGEDEFDEDEEADDDDFEHESCSSGIAALRAALDELEGAEEGLAEAQAQLSLYAGVSGYSPSESSSLSSRLELIDKLARRFRVAGSAQLLELAAGWSQQLEDYYDSLGQQEVWRGEAQSLLGHITATATALSAARVAAGSRLASAVQGCLAQLAMSASRFGVDIAWRPVDQAGPSSRAILAPTAAQPQTLLTAAGNGANSADSSSTDSSSSSRLFALSPLGLDAVTFLLSAGPAEPLRPLAATASGGEAARIMLALKAAPAAAAAAAAAAAEAAGIDATEHSSSSGSSGGSDAAAGVMSLGPPILVLDELDAGVGSRLGEPVGRLLAGLVGAAGARGGDSSSSSGSSSSGAPAAACQVLVVTHTPQVAAHAAHHICVSKALDGSGRVTSHFRTLDSHEARCAELADMLGLREGEGTHLAAELLAAAHGAAAPPGGSSSSSSSSAADDTGGSVLASHEQQEEGQQEHNAVRSSSYTAGGDEGSGSSSSCQVDAADPQVLEAATAGGDGINGSSSSSSNDSSNGGSSSSSRWLLGLSAAAAAAGVAAANSDHGPAAAVDGQHGSDTHRSS